MLRLHDWTQLMDSLKGPHEMAGKESREGREASNYLLKGTHVTCLSTCNSKRFYFDGFPHPEQPPKLHSTSFWRAPQSSRARFWGAWGDLPSEGEATKLRTSPLPVGLRLLKKTCQSYKGNRILCLLWVGGLKKASMLPFLWIPLLFLC